MSTKIHATVDALGNPTQFHLTGGHESDLVGADVLLASTPAAVVIADKGYNAQERVVDPLLGKAKKLSFQVAGIAKKNAHTTSTYKACHLIENFFARLKQYRCIATRYDKTAEAFLGGIHLAAAVIWLN